MKFVLYIELGVRVVDASLLNLPGFPGNGVDLRGEWFARWWSRGKTRQMHSSQRERIFQRISSERINELTLKWKRSGIPSLVESVQLASATITFFPSPFTDLWAEVPIHRLKSPSENRARMNFRNIESVLTEAYKIPFPSVLECFLDLETTKESLGNAELHELAIKWLAAVIPESLASLDVFGYGCVHGTCRRRLMTMSLGFPEIDQLGAKFERVYPILIGPRESCAGLANALGYGSVVPISDKAPSAILSIPPDQAKQASQNPAAKTWLVDKPPVPDKRGPRVWVVPPKK